MDVIDTAQTSHHMNSQTYFQNEDCYGRQTARTMRQIVGLIGAAHFLDTSQQGRPVVSGPNLAAILSRHRQIATTGTSGWLTRHSRP